MHVMLFLPPFTCHVCFQKVTEEEDQKADEYTEISDEDSEVYDQIIEAEDEINVDARRPILGNLFILIMQKAL